MIEISMQTDWNVNFNNWIPFPSLIHGHFSSCRLPFIEKNHQELRRRQRSAHELLDEELHAWLHHKTVKYSANDGIPYGFGYAMPKNGIPVEVYD